MKKKYLEMTATESFPYKREFIDPNQLWEGVTTLDLATPQIIPEPNRDVQLGWRSIPGFLKWQFRPMPSSKPEPTAFVTIEGHYDKMNKLVDYFSDTARMEACRKGKPSPKDFYMRNYNELLQEAKALQAKDDRNLPIRYWLREAVYLNKAKVECTSFKISVTKGLFKYLGSKAVLDGSAGWGDRLLGAAAAGVPVYDGFDVNEKMRPAYAEMITFIKGKNPVFDYTVTLGDFLQAELEPDAYDTFFTSPPYFDYEIYSDDPGQSVVQFPSVEDWINRFLIPYVNQGWRAVAKGGYFCVYINDVKGAKYVARMYNHINSTLKGTFLGIIAITDEELSYGYPIWIWRK